jgi:hypothetical protein
VLSVQFALQLTGSWPLLKRAVPLRTRPKPGRNKAKSSGSIGWLKQCGHQ